MLKISERLRKRAEKALRQERERILTASEKHYRASETDIWEYSVLTKSGKYRSHMRTDRWNLFFADPPVLRSLTTDKSAPRVLVVTTGAESWEIQKSNPLVPNSHLHKIYQICLTRGWKEVEIIYCTEAALFWRNFFNMGTNGDFLDGGDRAYTVNLIITTGLIRGHDRDGTGQTARVLKRLREIGKKWGVPVKKIARIDRHKVKYQEFSHLLRI